jgi:hypothetical protein
MDNDKRAMLNAQCQEPWISGTGSEDANVAFSTATATSASAPLRLCAFALKIGGIGGEESGLTHEGNLQPGRIRGILSLAMFYLDLTQRPPRSPRVRLGGFAILPRILDKCRALIHEENGEYDYDCPTDQEFFQFAGIDPGALKAQVATGCGDTEVLAWVMANAGNKPTASQIDAWSAFQDRRAPCDLEMREFYQECHQKLAPGRADLTTWFDLLDLDDYVSFGGRG